MTRNVDVLSLSSPAQGYDMVKQARKKFVNPSPAEGVYPVGVVDAANAGPDSPDAVLGTGSNIDIAGTIVANEAV